MTPLERHIELMSALATRSAQPADLAGLMDGRREPGNRALVYRNSGYAAVTSALKSNFPGLAGVMSETSFGDLARAYSDAYPPRLRTLTGYGDRLADYIYSEAGTDEFAWTRDVARLDRAWLESHLSEDGPVLDPGSLSEQDQALLLDGTVRLHPSVRVVVTDWEVLEVWKSARIGALAGASHIINDSSEIVLYWRPHHEVMDRRLSSAEAAFLLALKGGTTLSGACADVLAEIPSADLTALVAWAFSAELISNIEFKEGTE
jgi:hypothetical protein